MAVQKPSDMPAGRNHAASCTDGSKLFVFGGRSGRNVVGPGFDDTQIYTPGVSLSSANIVHPLTVSISVSSNDCNFCTGEN